MRPSLMSKDLTSVSTCVQGYTKHDTRRGSCRRKLPKPDPFVRGRSGKLHPTKYHPVAQFLGHSSPGRLHAVLLFRMKNLVRKFAW
jgi:hypothetical protein